MERSIQSRAREIHAFLNLSYDDVLSRLARGFHHNHKLVADDFDADVNDEQSLIDWYRRTDSYIYELSAYHLDDGFNYMGMCEGIAQHLKTSGKTVVLVLGDGIGDLSMILKEEGLTPVYHDLNGSKNAEFAAFRFRSAGLDIDLLLGDSFDPTLPGGFDAVVALDFLEHVVNVDEWVHAIHDCLNAGGIFLAQNAFGIGDEEHGNSIPMHLSINNKYVTEWGNLVRSVGFNDLGNGWLEKS